MTATQLSMTDSFDYGDVAVAKAKKCRAAAERIVKCQRRVACEIVQIGEQLITVKDILEHGLFGKWLRHHFEWSDRSARRMMQAAEVFSSANLANLNIEQSALYAMAEEACPDEVREQLLEQAMNEVITHAKVRQAIADFTQDDEEADEPEPDTKDVDDCDCPTGEITVEVTGMEVVIEWSLGDFLVDMNRNINRWLAVCPQDDVDEVATALRELADEVAERHTCIARGE